MITHPINHFQYHINTTSKQTLSIHLPNHVNIPSNRPYQHTFRTLTTLSHPNTHTMPNTTQIGGTPPFLRSLRMERQLPANQGAQPQPYSLSFLFDVFTFLLPRFNIFLSPLFHLPVPPSSTCCFAMYLHCYMYAMSLQEIH